MSVSGLGLGGYHDCAKAKLGPRIWSWSGRLWSIQRRVSSCHLLRADWWCWADDSGVAVVIIIIYQCCYVTAIQFKSNHSFFLFLVSVLAWSERPTYPSTPYTTHHSLHHNRTNTPPPATLQYPSSKTPPQSSLCRPKAEASAHSPSFYLQGLPIRTSNTSRVNHLNRRASKSSLWPADAAP